MGIKKFIKSVTEVLNLDDFSERKKKKAIKKLLKKLEAKKDKVKKSLNDDLKDSKKIEIKEELALIKYHIKKGKKLLNELEKK